MAVHPPPYTTSGTQTIVHNSCNSDLFSSSSPFDTSQGLSRGPSIPSSLLRYPDLRRLYIGLDPLGYQPNTLTRLAEVYRSLASHSDLEEVHLNANVTGKRFYNETRTLFSTLMRLHGRLKVLRVDGMSPPQDIVRTFGTRLPGLWELGLTMTEDIVMIHLDTRNCC